MSFKTKYLKYKTKYIALRNQYGGTYDCAQCNTQNIKDGEHCNCPAASANQEEKKQDDAPFIYVQNLADAVLPVKFDENMTIAKLKRIILDSQFVNCEYKQVKLFIDDQNILYDNSSILANYQINKDMTIHVLCEPLEFGSPKRDIKVSYPESICIAKDGTLFICTPDMIIPRIKILKPNSQLEKFTDRNIKPRYVCLSHDNMFLFVGIDKGIEVFNAETREFIKTIGEKQLEKPNGMCVSNDNMLLFVAHNLDQCIKVFNISDGTLKLTIPINDANTPTPYAVPTGICLSPDNKLLFVAIINRPSVVKVFNADNGNFVRDITITGRVTLSDMCMSTTGELYIIIHDISIQKFKINTDATNTPDILIGSIDIMRTGGRYICLSFNNTDLYMSGNKESITVYQV